jgi:hypothetical protein
LRITDRSREGGHGRLARVITQLDWNIFILFYILNLRKLAFSAQNGEKKSEWVHINSCHVWEVEKLFDAI